ncbi:acetyltransferase [Brevundimonas vesicularis]|uniref:acetyltransferase n=1 Tax=Brevundimonas vesicularis TaxID=41276 RepID=UPI00384CF183
MTERLAVFGGGGHGQVVADCAERCGFGQVDVFDDDASRSSAGPFCIVGTRADLMRRVADYDGVVVAIGNNTARIKCQRALEVAGARMAVLIHPKATVSRHVRLGSGSVILAGAVVNIGADLGRATVVNTGATVDHDCSFADGVHVAPGAHLAGGVVVGEATWIGVGAVIREYLTIGNRVFIGAGAVVIKSLPDGLTVVGNPARPLQR